MTTSINIVLIVRQEHTLNNSKNKEGNTSHKHGFLHVTLPKQKLTLFTLIIYAEICAEKETKQKCSFG